MTSYPKGFHSRTVRREPLRVALSTTDPLAQRKRIDLATLADRLFEVWPRDMAPGFYDTIVGTCRTAGFEPQLDEQAAGNTVWGNLTRGRGVALINASLAEQLPRGITLVELAQPHRNARLRRGMAPRRTPPHPAITPSRRPARPRRGLALGTEPSGPSQQAGAPGSAPHRSLPSPIPGTRDAEPAGDPGQGDGGQPQWRSRWSAVLLAQPVAVPLPSASSNLGYQHHAQGPSWRGRLDPALLAAGSLGEPGPLESGVHAGLPGPGRSGLVLVVDQDHGLAGVGDHGRLPSICCPLPAAAGTGRLGRVPWRARFSADRLFHERGDPCLGGGGQLRQREGDRPQGAVVEVRRVVEAERRIPGLELLRGLEEADDLAVLGVGGHPIPGSRREGRRAGFDEGMDPLGQGAVRLGHLGDLREHVAVPVRLSAARG